MKKLVVTSFLSVLFSTLSWSQNPLTQDLHNLNIKEQATSLRNAYDKELILMGEQELLFENKIEEYLINAKKIRESNLSLQEKMKAYNENYNQETADMSDILSKPQYQVYKNIKPTYQPLDSIHIGDVK